MKPVTGLRLSLVSVAFLLLHVGLDAGAKLFAAFPGVSLWYPPVGLALAYVMICGRPAIPVVLVANLLSAFVLSSATFSVTQCILPLLITAVYAGTGWVLHGLFGPVPSPRTSGRALMLIAIAVAAPVAAALLCPAVILLAGYVNPADYPRLVLGWGVGDLIGVLTITPLCLVHIAPRLVRAHALPRRRRTVRQKMEIVAEIAALLACLVVVHLFGNTSAHRTFYLTFIPLVWICLRHGLRGATLALPVLTVGSLISLRLSGASSGVILDMLLFEIAVASIGLGLGGTVTRRARVETERGRLMAMLEATPDFVATVDLDGAVLYQNSALLRFRGYTSAQQGQGRPVTDHQPALAAVQTVNDAIPTAVRTGHWEGETYFLDASGREVPVALRIIAHADADGEPEMLSFVARDLTTDKEAERARLEAERNLLQAQKLESLGVLAGGIAHDFNNLLTAMLGNATLARLDVEADTPAERSIHQIELAALRAAELCRQMLAYSGKGHIAAEAVDVSALVDQTIHLLKVSISKKCTLEFDLAASLPAVKGDATQLSQIAMNLVMNASDACGETGGHVVVRTGLVHADRGYLSTTYLSPNLEAGPYVFVEVSDDGCGMTPDVMARIFEPFFTTKFSGHGLGLSAVLGIVRSHGGAVRVDSAPGSGSTFRLLLPAAGALARPTPTAVPAPMPVMETKKGSGLVLVVDDEQSVRDVAALMLARSGYTAVCAGDGREAVDKFAAAPGRIRAVLLDLTMPVMNGAEAFREIRRLNPHVPVILMSGYNRTDSEAKFGDTGLAGFVQKPFDAARLRQALQSAIANAPETPAAEDARSVLTS